MQANGDRDHTQRRVGFGSAEPSATSSTKPNSVCFRNDRRRQARALRFSRRVCPCARTQWITRRRCSLSRSPAARLPRRRAVADIVPLVADMFRRRGYVECGARTMSVSWATSRRGSRSMSFVDALETLSERTTASGVVCGTGFEDRTQLLRRIAERWRLFGNGAEIVRNVKNPQVLSSICADFDIPFPEISLSSHRPRPIGWPNAKGERGGTHIKPARQSSSIGERNLLPAKSMRRRRYRLLFSPTENAPSYSDLAPNGRLSTSGQPYRYGGAVRPATLAPYIADLLSAAVERLAAGRRSWD